MRDSTECVCVSELDGAWMIRVPTHFELGAVLEHLYLEWSSHQEGWERAGDSLRMLLFNLVYVSSIANGYYHKSIEMLTACYANPSMLEEGSKDYAGLMQDVEKVKEGFFGWRKMWDEEKAKVAAQAEAETHYDETAEKAIDALVKEEGGAN